MAIIDILNMLYDDHPEWSEEQIIAAANAIINGK